MAREFVWTLVVLLLPPLYHAQSGDGPEDDQEPDMDCTSELSLKGNYLICKFTDELIGTNITISSKGLLEPFQLTLEGSNFTVPIKSITHVININIHGSERGPITKNMKLIVKLPAPQTVTATYFSPSGDVNILVPYQHDRVKSWMFEAHVWNTTNIMTLRNTTGNFIIPWEDLKVGSDYSVRIRVKPNGHFSGDWSDWSPSKSFTVDTEPTMDCYSELSLVRSNLTCIFAKELIGTNISISSRHEKILQKTLNGSNFTVPIHYIIPPINISIQGKGCMIRFMKDMVKLPAPHTVTALGNGSIYVPYKPDYVTVFDFEVYIWNTTSNMTYENGLGDIIIPHEDLKGGSEYFVKVRVRPSLTQYYRGRWSDWSPQTGFVMDKDSWDPDSELRNSGDVSYNVVLWTIILCVICVVLLMVGLLTRLRGQKFKAYIMPNVPHPKTTLVHMQKFNKGLLLSFTPETFNDIHINRLDEGSSSSSSSGSSSGGGVKDKASAPAPDSMLDQREGGTAPGSGPRSPSSHSQLSCQLLLWQPPLGLGTQDGSLGDSESTTLQDDEEFWDDEPEDHGDGDDDGEEEEEEDIMEDLSSAEERLLGGTDGDSGTAADSGDSQPSSIGMRSAVQEGRKDEAYVTMSSLFKTQ